MVAATSFWSRVVRRIEVNRDVDVDADMYLSRDTRPLPPSRRTYGPWEFVGLWMVTGSFNVGGWATGSSVISLGLNVWLKQSMVAICIANAFVALLCIAAGQPGAQWHIGFPMWMKQNWGVWGYLFPMAIRIFLSFVWTATNCWYGCQCLKVLLACIWPSFLHLNTELAGGAMQVCDFVAFLLYILLCLPLMWTSPERYRRPFMVASVTVATTVLVLLIWCTARAGGGGAMLSDTSAVSGVPPAQPGRQFSWAFVNAITATIGGVTTHMWSQSDFTRYARRSRDQILAQLVMVPLGSTFVAMAGIVCTSCAATLYPQQKTLLWQPYALLDAMRRYEDGPGARAGVAFASIAFMVSQFGLVVANNSVVSGIDLAALFPRWFTVRRGGYLTIALAFVMQPWSLYNSATNFLTVVSSFNVFLGPLMGIMFLDFFWVRRRTVKLTALYSTAPESPYYYTRGWNMRAVVAWPMGVWFLMPGLVQKAQAPKADWGGWSDVYKVSWWAGSLVSATTYWALNYFWPVPEPHAVDDQDYFGTFTEDPLILGVEKGASTPVQEDEKGEMREAVSVV